MTPPATSFVGREAEVREVAGLLREHRLVTLTGVGGVGKTRLALQVAAGMVADFPDGIWLVELAPVGDGQAVPEAVAGVLGVTTTSGSAPADTIARTLSGRRVLIVVDNCEHLLDASADLVETVLARTTTTTVLATSREGLRVDGEQVWPVPSLGTDEGSGSAAVELFVERARSVNPAFELGDPTATEAVIEICRRLDGIALAIELAAARMASMGPQDVRDRLSDRFRLLAGSRRGLERHQTLRHAVGWSYDLLDDDERTVLNRCSVFSGGFDLAAAAHLCRDAGFDEYRVVDLVDSLVRKSLVTTEQAGGRARYGMLETVRQFAEEQLATTAGIEARPRRPRRLLRAAGRRALAALGRARSARRARMGRRGARQPPGRLPLGDGDLRCRGGGDHRRPHRTRGRSAAAVRAFRLVGGDPPRRDQRRRAVPAPPVRGRQLLRLHRPAPRRRRVRGGGVPAAGRARLRADRGPLDPPLGGQRQRPGPSGRSPARHLRRSRGAGRPFTDRWTVWAHLGPPRSPAGGRGDRAGGGGSGGGPRRRQPVPDQLGAARARPGVHQRRPGPRPRRAARRSPPQPRAAPGPLAGRHGPRRRPPRSRPRRARRRPRPRRRLDRRPAWGRRRHQPDPDARQPGRHLPAARPARRRRDPVRLHAAAPDRRPAARGGARAGRARRGAVPAASATPVPPWSSRRRSATPAAASTRPAARDNHWPSGSPPPVPSGRWMSRSGTWRTTSGPSGTGSSTRRSCAPCATRRRTTRTGPAIRPRRNAPAISSAPSAAGAWSAPRTSSRPA